MFYVSNKSNIQSENYNLLFSIYRSKHTTYLEQRIEKWQLVCERILLINELLFCILPHLNVPPTYVFCCSLRIMAKYNINREKTYPCIRHATSYAFRFE